MVAGREAPDVPQFAGALIGSGPCEGLAEKMHLFGQFVGSWSLTWIGRGSKNDREPMLGELHFSWVLGGRAVQDVWIVPARDQGRGPDPRIGFFGSTIRFYDPSLDAWQSTWIEPFKGRVRRFIGRHDDDDNIVLVSDDDEPCLRWRFTEIGASSFVWLGETSTDRGATWELEEEMRATRAKGAA